MCGRAEDLWHTIGTKHAEAAHQRLEATSVPPGRVGWGRGRRRDGWRASLDQVHRDLGPGVSGADRQHRATGIGSRAAIPAGVEELAGEAVASFPVGEERIAVEPGGDD